MRIAKTFEAHAAHRLRRHKGKCKNLHGHTYKIEVEVDGPQDDESGMVMDFDILKQWWRDFEGYIDHTTILEADDVILEKLYELSGEDGIPVTALDFPPTAENIAIWIKDSLVDWLKGRAGLFDLIHVSRVRVWETPTSWAEV